MKKHSYGMALWQGMCPALELPQCAYQLHVVANIISSAGIRTPHSTVGIPPRQGAKLALVRSSETCENRSGRVESLLRSSGRTSDFFGGKRCVMPPPFSSGTNRTSCLLIGQLSTTLSTMHDCPAVIEMVELLLTLPASSARV
jgi:hypothetical protein